MAELLNIPILAVGGINDARGVKVATALGNSVFIGTRFILTKESPASNETKATMYLDKPNNIDTSSEINKIGRLKPAMLDGKLNKGIISVNTGIDIIKDIPTVFELVDQLFKNSIVGHIKDLN